MAFWACGPRSPPEGPKQRRREGKRKATGTPEAAEREPGDSRKEARGKCNRRALRIYKGPRSRQGAPGRGSRERMEPDGWLSLVWVGFWACGPRSPPEGPKQRRREGKGRQRGRQKQQREPGDSKEGEIQGRKPGGSATDGRCVYIRGPVPGKRRPEEEAEREWSRTVGCL